MTGEILWGACAALALAVGCALAAYSLRTLRRLEHMLRQAQDGTWRAQTWQEKRLSRLENQLARVLSAGALSRRRLDDDRAHIQRLVSDVSHQVKTPLANILLYTDLLSEQPLPDKPRQLVQEIERQSQKLEFLTDALVKTSRLEGGLVQVRPKLQPVRPLLDGLAATWAPRAQQKGIRLECPSGGDFCAAFDAKWTVEAVGNLLDNAVKYTPPGEGACICLTAQKFTMFCRITVSDTGPGLDESEKAHIFERFYRGEGTGDAPGVGLGLYLARQIATLQGGYLRVDGRKGQGTAVSVFLPRELDGEKKIQVIV